MRLILLLATALPAFAQEAQVQRALIERDQQSAQFATRLRGATPADLQALEALAARQVLPGIEPRPDARPVAARETEAFVLRLAAPVARPRTAELPRPLPARPAGAVPPVSGPSDL